MKKLLALVLAAVMVFSFAACGSSPKSDNSDNGSASTDSANNDSTGTDSSAETLKIGAIGPLTGGYANYGLSVKAGAELAIKEINAAGGIAGKRVELSFQDS